MHAAGVPTPAAVTTDDDGYSTLPTSSAAGTAAVVLERRARSASPSTFHAAQEVAPTQYTHQPIDIQRALSDSHLADDIRECSVVYSMLCV